MQLRRPMMLDRVSVLGWDGQWRAAAPVGSPVSALGAASLPLELQLEDPCRASWEAFGRTREWRQLTGTQDTDDQPINYILLYSLSAIGRSWSNIRLTGRKVTLYLEVRNTSDCPFRELSAMPAGSSACFVVTGCFDGPIRCYLELVNGSTLRPLQLHYPEHLGKSAEFMFTASAALHGATLICHQGDQRSSLIQRTIGIVVHPLYVNLTVTSAWVLGRTIAVNFTSALAYPVQLHSCLIVSGSSTWQPVGFSMMQSSKAKNINDLTVVSQKSQFRFVVSRAMLGGTVSCNSKRSRATPTEAKFANLDQFRIEFISEPCLTVVNLGASEPAGRQVIRVTSLKCSAWSVNHTCWIQSADGKDTKHLVKLSEGDFNSSHSLQTGAIDNTALIRCSVNQSGVLYPDVEVRFDQLTYAEVDQGQSTLNFSLLAIAFILVAVASSLLTRYFFTHVHVRRPTAVPYIQDSQQVTMQVLPSSRPIEQSAVQVAHETTGSSAYDYPTVEVDPNGVYEEADESNGSVGDIYTQVRLLRTDPGLPSTPQDTGRETAPVNSTTC